MFHSLLLLIASSVAAASPLVARNCSNAGGRFVLTDGGMNEIIAILLPIVEKAANNITIPDIHLDEHVIEPIGHITLDLTQIKLSGFTLSGGTLKPIAPSSIEFGLDGLAFSLQMNYKWRKVHAPHASDHGVVSATASKGVYDLVLSVKPDSEGRPSLVATSDNLTLGQFDVHFDGKVAWLYNLFVSAFHKEVMTAVVTAVNGAISGEVTKLADALLTNWPANITIGGGKSESTIETGLACTHADTATFSLSDALEVKSHLTGKECPFVPKTLPFTLPGAASSEMIQILVSDTVARCVFWVDYSNKVVFDLPAGTTKAWALLIPPLHTKYPNDNVSLAVSLETAPVILLGPSQMYASLVLLADSSVIDVVTKQVTHTHTLRLELEAHLAVNIIKPSAIEKNISGTLDFNVTSLATNATVASSDIGPIPPAGLKLFSAIFGPLCKGLVDKLLAGGIPLPALPPFELVDPIVTTYTGYLGIASNFKMVPASSYL